MITVCPAPKPVGLVNEIALGEVLVAADLVWLMVVVPVATDRAPSLPSPYCETVHLPLEQTCPRPQELPHPPQLALLVSGSTQAPLQLMPLTHWQVLATHAWPAAQVMPQPPQ